MNRLQLIAALLVCVGAAAPAQRGIQSGIPTDAANAVASLFNAPDTRREIGAVDISRDSVVRGTLAVRGGPVVVSGHVTGSLVVINGDLIFRNGARVDGQVIVVGGVVSGRDVAEIGSDFRAYAETLRYRISGDELVVSEELPEQRVRPSTRREHTDDFWGIGHRSERTTFDFFSVAGAGTYNRVEGWPVLVGPRLTVHRDWGSYMLQTRGIVRLVEPMEWNRGTLGHDARTELRFGTGAGLGIGAAAFDKVDPVEGWQMPDNEVGYAAVGIHRDFRDYYSRHGGEGYLTMYATDKSWIRAGYGEERWESRVERDAWSLFHGDDPWRPNPAIDDGRTRIAKGSLRVDTRNSSDSPGAGWFVQADVTREKFEPTPGPVTPPSRTYSRAFADFRRYNRLAPHAQLNLRAVVGGWIDGDPLPLSRRLSASGPGTLPGFDFRRHRGGEDRLQCSEGGAATGLPALCDRVALVQVEYRGSLSWDTGYDHGAKWMPLDIDTPTWVVFADAGRGWRAKDDGVTTYAIESFPSLSTFKTDLGIGLDFGSLSVAVAKSVSDKDEPANLVIRLARRF
ncbi:MAG TPA: hypothetical protein VJR92_10185 [Gemmatimonadaceae bacterium]|nr:hypothetical protein [Gemmatimonadaceae bacterium]